MRIALHVDTNDVPLDDLVAEAEWAAATGLDAVYVNEVLGWDPIALAALIGARVPGIDVGTAVALTYPRHPRTLASQALTAQAATGNRFVLGVGPGHRSVIEGSFGRSYDKPARHVRDYLTELRPLLDGGTSGIPNALPPKLLLSALGPVMLRIADELTDGTMTTWTTAQGIADHVAPRLTGKEIVSSVLVGVTDEPDAVKQTIAGQLGFASDLPNYRQHLDRQGLRSVVDTTVVGDETLVGRELRRYAEAGVTELVVSIVGDDRERTQQALAALR